MDNSSLIYTKFYFDWKDKGKKIFGTYALTHTKTGETKIFGKYGQVYQISKDTIGIVVTSARLANKLNKRMEIIEGYQFSNGEELFFSASIYEIDDYLKLLQVGSLAKQLFIANHGGLDV